MPYTPNAFRSRLAVRCLTVVLVLSAKLVHARLHRNAAFATVSLRVASYTFRGAGSSARRVHCNPRWAGSGILHPRTGPQGPSGKVDDAPVPYKNASTIEFNDGIHTCHKRR